MIYTTYFANLRNLPKEIIPISICAKAPSWYTGLQYKKLAPKYGFFMEWKKNHDNDYYIKHFNKEILESLNPKDIVRELFLMAGNTKGINYYPGIALVCYESKPPEDMIFEEINKSDKYFCHRHLVAGWLNNNGFDVKEYIK